MIRNYLFLQGPISPFFKVLGDELQAQGHNVLKANFHAGDRYFWDGENTIDFVHDNSKWGDYVRDIAKLRKVTDLVVYSDCRDLHKIAIDVLKKEGIRIHVFEEGYFRPNWITYEMNGVNAHSAIPRNPEFYEAYEEEPMEQSESFGSSHYIMMFYSLCYSSYGITCWFFGQYKKYKHHFEMNPIYIVGIWIPKILLSFWNKLKAKYEQNEILKLSYFLVPLQLCRDYQIKLHSQFDNVPAFVDYVISNFSRNADAKDNLVLKLHPLDSEPFRVTSAVYKAARKYNVEDRVILIDGGHLPTLINHCKGVVVVNSTTGLSSIHHHRPTMALSQAIYNFEGLTNQCKLEEFWKDPQLPNDELYKKFRNYVIYKTQINGSFYVKKGIEVAARKAAKLMIKNSANNVKSLEVS
jgi:capsular polysaccharide export protein